MSSRGEIERAPSVNAAQKEKGKLRSKLNFPTVKLGIMWTLFSPTDRNSLKDCPGVNSVIFLFYGYWGKLPKIFSVYVTAYSETFFYEMCFSYGHKQNYMNI